MLLYNANCHTLGEALLALLYNTNCLTLGE